MARSPVALNSSIQQPMSGLVQRWESRYRPNTLRLALIQECFSAP
jgi:hypothetical protein